MALPISGQKSARHPNIDPIGPLDYILDLGHTWNCSWIGKAAPGEAIKVLLYPARDPSAVRIVGTGTRTPNGESLMVSFTTPDGERGSYTLDYLPPQGRNQTPSQAGLTLKSSAGRSN
jgi:hypothetical protein